MLDAVDGVLRLVRTLRRSVKQFLALHFLLNLYKKQLHCEDFIMSGFAVLHLLEDY